MPDSDSNDAPLLSVRDLSAGFRVGRAHRQVTRDVTFTLHAGETLALVGESGSGKSVTAMSIVDLLPRNATRSGSIAFHGEELLDASPTRMRQVRGKEIGVVFQEPMTALNPVYTVGALLAQAIRAHDPRLEETATRRRALELLDLVEMPDAAQRLRRYPHELSGGQRQRAMIAMAVAHNPRLLIADEPTTALDVTAQAVILDLMLALRDRLGMSLLMITHDMGVVADISDRVVVMKDGAVIEEAPVDALFQAPQASYTQSLLASVPHLGRSPIVAATPTVTVPVIDPIDDVSHDGPMLAVRNLDVVYPGRVGQKPFHALSGVDLEVGRGEVVGLVGESGSGKSTLGRAVVGLVTPTSGEIEVTGIDVLRARGSQRRRIRRRTAIIFQDPASSLNPRSTIGETISAPLRWNRIERDRGELARRVRELLDSVHLPASFADRYPHELSGGQRQRVGIARAMAMRPDLLIADEPTSALDVSVQAAVLALLVELQERQSFSCLFISHDLSVVEQLAHRVVVLKAGKVVEAGETRRILHHPVDAYTRQLVSAIPVPDPVEQRARRARRKALLDSV